MLKLRISNLKLFVILTLTIILSGCGNDSPPPQELLQEEQVSVPTYDDIDSALGDIRLGQWSKAEVALNEIALGDSSGPVGDQASLILGNLLLNRKQPAAAIVPLKRAAQGSVADKYAKSSFA